MRVLLTGCGGFVAPYVVAALKRRRPQAELILTGQTAGRREGLGEIRALDIADAEAVAGLVAQARPSHVVHLAGITALPDAAADPNLAWTVNLIGTLNCARAVLKHAPEAAFLFAGSSQAYGSPPASGAAFREEDPLNPTSEYGATKAAADLALGMLAAQGLRAIRFRLFNHTGPDQTESFAVPSFVGQIVRIERGEQPPVIKVGNLDAERDFLDVRDVAEAYAAALERAGDIAPGAVFNISSGTGTRIRALLDALVAMAQVPIAVEIDPARWRDNDIPRLVGDPARARAALGWAPRLPLPQTLADMLAARRTI